MTMPPETYEEFLARTHDRAGTVPRESRHYSTHVCLHVTIETGDIVANSKREAEELAVERAKELVRLVGPTGTEDWEADVHLD
jgi:hypothetical protein